MTNQNNNFEPLSSYFRFVNNEIKPETPGFADNVVPPKNIHTENLQHDLPASNINIDEIWQKGYDQALAEIDRDAQRMQEIHKQVMSSIGSQLENISSSLMNLKKQQSEILLKLALTAAKKVAKNLVNENAELFLKEYITESLQLLHKESNITIFVNHLMLDSVISSIEVIKRQVNYEGVIVIKPADNIHEINCVIEWHDGMIEYDFDALWEEIEKVSL